MAMKGMKSGGMVCNCPHHKYKHIGKVLAFLFIGLGFMYPDNQYQWWIGLYLVLFGLMVFFSKWCKCCNN